MRKFYDRLRGSCSFPQVAVALVCVFFITSCGKQSIQDAAKDGDLDAVKSMLAADPNLVSNKDGNGWTPLHWAAAYGHKDVAELLLSNHAAVNDRDGKGETPVLLSVLNSHKEVEDILRAHGGHE